MKIDRRIFTETFMKVSAAVPAKTTRDILKNTRMVSDGTTLTLSASDSEIHMEGSVPYVGEKESTLLPTGRMVAILRELEGEILILTITPGKLRVQCGFADYNIGTEDADLFPKVPTFDADSYFSVESAPLAESIRRTIFSVDEKATHYCLGGIQIEPTNDSLTLASTDSRRLSVARCDCKPVNNPEVPQNKPVVHTTAFKLIEKSLGTEPCFIACKTNEVSFKIGNISITAQMIQGRFPDYNKVIPTTFTRKVLIPVSPFSSLVKRARVMESPESTALNLTFGKGSLTAASDTMDIGTAQDEMPIADDNEKMTIRFGGSYVADLLKCLDQSSSVEVCLTQPDDRALFVVERYSHVIMPLFKD